MPDNLWPDFKTEPRPHTVRRVLLEAGEGLSEQTKNEIQFVVQSRLAGKGARFVHECHLYVPKLNYMYPLAKVVENGDPYPVTLVGDGTFQEGVPAGNEAALVENLKLLFRSDATKKTVMQLLDAVS
jgi:hypothetical protein